MMDINEILKVLPHRYPFILIDRIIAIDPPIAGSWVGRKCAAIKNVTINEPFFMGHFPGKPVMPGVLMIEAMAQAAGLCAYKPPEGSASMEVLIVGIDNARFRRMVVPGDTLRINVEIVKERGTLFSFHCEAYVDSELACEADILAKSFFKKV